MSSMCISAKIVGDRQQPTKIISIAFLIRYDKISIYIKILIFYLLFENNCKIKEKWIFSLPMRD